MTRREETTVERRGRFEDVPPPHDGHPARDTADRRDEYVERREVVESDGVAAQSFTAEDRVVHADAASVGRGMGRTFSLVILALLAIVETLLAFRLGFLAGEANPNNGFVDFIYDATGWLVDPFEGIITNETFENGGVFDYATLIAMIVYAVAAFLLILLVTALTSFPSTSQHSTVTRTSESERLGHGH